LKWSAPVVPYEPEAPPGSGDTAITVLFTPLPLAL
jgi:hypothetical protein